MAVPPIASEILSTMTGRPWVLALLACFLVGAVTKMGWVRAAVFAAIAFGVALGAEIASVRWGVPFGPHRFTDPSAPGPWLGGVPAWSPLVFCALAWLGFQSAVLLHSPVEAGNADVQTLDTLEIRGSARVLLAGAVLTMLPQVLLAPLSVRGDRWFLGRVHEFAGSGLFFGVPPLAIAGWALVAAVAIFLFQRIEPWLVAPRPVLRAGQVHLQLGGLFEPLAWLGIAVVGIAVALAIGEPALAMVGVFVFVPLAIVYGAHLVGPAARATALEREAHRRDFPRSPALG
ncbi:MAG: carotenoid biosynthesis protein [Alphaproteobacteria bacterium]